MKVLLTTLMFAVLLAPVAGAAQKPAAAGKASKATGTVVSATDTSLVISSGKSKQATYVLNATTKRDGTIAPGAKVTVQYHMEGTSRVASAVSASGSGMTAASTGAKPAAKRGAKAPTTSGSGM